MRNVDQLLNGRISAQYSVVAGSISCGGDQGTQSWWELIRSKKLSSGFVCRKLCLLDFLVMVIQFIRINKSVAWHWFIITVLFIASTTNLPDVANIWSDWSTVSRSNFERNWVSVFVDSYVEIKK